MAGIRHYSLFSLMSIACLALTSAVGVAIDRARTFFTEIISNIARPFIELVADYEPMQLRSTLAYAAPTDNYLRHEAGMSQRAAARHV
jgi:hypothetical protein